MYTIKFIKCGPSADSIIIHNNDLNRQHIPEIDDVFSEVENSNHLCKLHIFVGKVDEEEARYIIVKLKEIEHKFKKIVFHPYSKKYYKNAKRVIELYNMKFLSENSNKLVISKDNSVYFNIGKNGIYNYYTHFTEPLIRLRFEGNISNQKSKFGYGYKKYIGVN